MQSILQICLTQHFYQRKFTCVCEFQGSAYQVQTQLIRQLLLKVRTYCIKAVLHLSGTSGSLVRSSARVTDCAEYCIFSLFLCGFPFGSSASSQTHDNTWIGNTALPLGVNVCVHGCPMKGVLYFLLMPTVLGKVSVTLTRIKRLLKMNE